ncbi:hypothetical protein ACFY2Y_09395 [Janibacter hoylei]|uniref:hypothetical protein n=1 Tax=Janibacter hoylei TaxID=364298 RepID=UPI0036B0F529
MSTAQDRTALIVAAIEGALAEHGHADVEVPTDPTVADLERLCALIDVKVWQLIAAVEARNCPAWCLGTHPVNDPAHHVAVIHARSNITLSMSQGLGQDVTIFVPEDVERGLTPERARHLALALTMAADAADEGGQS